MFTISINMLRMSASTRRLHPVRWLKLSPRCVSPGSKILEYPRLNTFVYNQFGCRPADAFYNGEGCDREFPRRLVQNGGNDNLGLVKCGINRGEQIIFCNHIFLIFLWPGAAQYLIFDKSSDPSGRIITPPMSDRFPAAAR